MTGSPFARARWSRNRAPNRVVHDWRGNRIGRGHRHYNRRVGYCDRFLIEDVRNNRRIRYGDRLGDLKRLTGPEAVTVTIAVAKTDGSALLVAMTVSVPIVAGAV